MQTLYASNVVRLTLIEEESKFYEASLPDFIWPTIEKLYQSIFFSEAHLRINGSISKDTCAWVHRREGVIKALLLFEREKRSVRVISEVIALEKKDLAEFSKKIFKQYSDITAIFFHAIKINVLTLPTLPYWSQYIKFSEDFILPLPESEESWLRSLSKQTREKIRYHMRRSQRKHPDLKFHHASGSQISDAEFLSIIKMNRARMKIKGLKFGMDTAEENNLRALVRESGLLTMLKIEDKICAGLLSTVCGKDVTMHVIAHDPAFDDLRPGFLCCCQTIQHCINQGMQRFHFLWGEYDYKTKLGGKREELMDLVIYKSIWHTVLHPRLVIKIWLGSLRQTYRNWRKKTQGVLHVR